SLGGSVTSLTHIVDRRLFARSPIVACLACTRRADPPGDGCVLDPSLPVPRPLDPRTRSCAFSLDCPWSRSARRSGRRTRKARVYDCADSALGLSLLDGCQPGRVPVRTRLQPTRRSAPECLPSI